MSEPSTPKTEEEVEPSIPTENAQESQQVSSAMDAAEPGAKEVDKADVKKVKDDREVSSEGGRQKPTNHEQVSQRLQDFVTYNNDELARMEKLIIKKAQTGIHVAYRNLWVSDANRFFKLTVNFKKRREKLRQDDLAQAEKDKELKAS